ncbi:MAG: 2-dehydro-3-deoxygalactonokinase [Amaricoccus sp.]
MSAGQDWIAADWIAVDWGTSNLRVWAMDEDGRVLAEASSTAGMGSLRPEDFEPMLLDLIIDWIDVARATDVLACGMVGARQGWAEAGYVTVPGAPSGPLTRAPSRDAGIAVHILPGMRQLSPPDLMRGEETQIAGLLVREPGFDGVVCLPGTHTKWAHVSAGEVVSFTSYMTGELFALLAGQSVLRHTVGREGWSDADFAEAVQDAMARPERVSSRLFGLRAEAILSDLSPERSRARLSGLLIGAELAGARSYWLGRDLAMIGASRLVDAYGVALGLVGQTARRLDAAEMTLAGLTAARAAMIAGRRR